MVRTILTSGALALAACGGRGTGAADGPVAPDAPADAPVIDAAMIDAAMFDAGVIPVDEPPDCGGDPLIARGGDVALAVSSLTVLSVAEAYDLDGDGVNDNKLAALASIAQDAIDTGLAGGTFVIPIEIFDRDADPDPCVKLAVYRGSCATPGCDLTDDIADTVALDPTSYDAGGVPYSRMRALATDAGGGLIAQPGFIRIDLPFQADAYLPLPITVQQASGAIAGAGPTATLTGFRFGGVMQAFRLQTVPMSDIPEIGTMTGDSMLDGIFANLLGPLLALPHSPFDSTCRAADIDLDGDGIESFCDTNPDDLLHRVDTCIDGDGSVVHDGDGGVAECTDAVVGGVPRFPDGVSAAMMLSARAETIAP